MKKYIKNVFVNGEQKYEKDRVVDAEYMMGIFERIIIYKQCGHDYSLKCVSDSYFNTIQYIVTIRFANGRIVVHTYDVVDC